MRLRRSSRMLTLVALSVLGVMSLVVGRGEDRYQKLRSYEGAPPVIPHAVEKELQATNCLACHQDGGHSSKYDKAIPVTPHPNYSMCTQCHVPQRTHREFKKNHFPKWENKSEPVEKTLESAPPMIPHGRQYRQDCLSCHSGHAAMKPTSHPKRVMCTQCHVQAKPAGRITVDE